MTNAIRAVSSLFKKSAHDPNNLHVGEVINIWKQFVFSEELVALEQVGRNTTIDADLTKLLDEAIKICSSQSERLKSFMEKEGVPIPDAPQDKPRSEPHAIPLGAKMTDNEIANILAAKLLLAVTECARGMMEAVRNDVGLLFADFVYEYSKFGGVLKAKMSEKNWLKVPPAYYPPGGVPGR